METENERKLSEVLAEFECLEQLEQLEAQFEALKADFAAMRERMESYMASIDTGKRREARYR